MLLGPVAGPVGRHDQETHGAEITVVALCRRCRRAAPRPRTARVGSRGPVDRLVQPHDLALDTRDEVVADEHDTSPGTGVPQSCNHLSTAASQGSGFVSSGDLRRGVAITMAFAVRLALSILHGWRIASLHSLPLAVIYVVCWLRYGRRVLEVPSLRWASRSTSCGRASVTRSCKMGRVTGTAVLLWIVLVVGLAFAGWRPACRVARSCRRAWRVAVRGLRVPRRHQHRSRRSAPSSRHPGAT